MVYDSLMGLVNCVYFEGCLSWIFSDCKINEYVVVLFFDGDCFKEINDNYGYVVGDVVFIIIVDCLCVLLCESDLVVCLGGDEFVILLVLIYNIDDVFIIVNNIIKSMI